MRDLEEKLERMYFIDTEIRKLKAEKANNEEYIKDSIINEGRTDLLKVDYSKVRNMFRRR